MQPPIVNKPQAPDIATQVTFAMRIMGISPIPRNYELYYEAYIGSNPKLTKELAALGSKATQDELDEIASRYFAHIHHAAGVERAHNKLVKQLTDLLTMMREEQFALENYNKVLGEAYQNITSKSASGVEILRNAVALISEATADTMKEGRERAETVEMKSVEMEVIRQELDEYKRIANTDSLTRLANRRAFDERLASLYNAEHARPFTTLLVADIDHFKKVNDTYGHPVATRSWRPSPRSSAQTSAATPSWRARAARNSRSSSPTARWKRAWRSPSAFAWRSPTHRSKIPRPASTNGPITLSLGSARRPSPTTRSISTRSRYRALLRQEFRPQPLDGL